MIIVLIVTWVFVYGVSIGPGFWTHAHETCIDSILGLSNVMIFTFLVLGNMVTPYLIE